MLLNILGGMYGEHLEQSRYKISSQPSRNLWVLAHTCVPSILPHPAHWWVWQRCQESGEPSTWVLSPCSDGALLGTHHIIRQVSLCCSGCDGQFWSHGCMVYVSLLFLHQSPITGWYMPPQKIPNPQLSLHFFDTDQGCWPSLIEIDEARPESQARLYWGPCCSRGKQKQITGALAHLLPGQASCFLYMEWG